MNAMLQRHCARYIYVIPEGLRELMSDISREVIRSQPENMYAFIADYLDALMITRENARVAARLIQTISEIATTTVEFLQNTGMDRCEADRVVEIIQRTFKRHIEVQPIEIQTEGIEEANIISNIINEANINPEQAEEAAIIIQRAFRKFKLRRDKERELLSGMIDWRIAARSAIQLYRRTGVTNEEANRAATLIKAAYKGYYTRRVLRKLAAESKFLDEGVVDLEELGAAEEEASGRRSVSIDYDTVIPHVDFDEPLSETEAAAAKREPSTASVVVAFAIQGIIDTAYPPSEPEVIPEPEIKEEPQPEPPQEEILQEVHEEPVEIKEEPEEVPAEPIQETDEGQPTESTAPEEGAPPAEDAAPPAEDIKQEEEVKPAEDGPPVETTETAEAAPPAEEKPAEEVQEPAPAESEAPPEEQPAE